MKLIVFVAIFGILNVSIGVSDENSISRYLKPESGGSTETEELVANPANQENRRTLGEILFVANKLIDSALNNSTCSKNQVNKFREFIIDRLRITDIDQLNKSYELLIKNIEIASERFKKDNARCENNQMFAMKREAFQGANFSFNDLFKGLWPFS